MWKSCKHTLCLLSNSSPIQLNNQLSAANLKKVNFQFTKNERENILWNVGKFNYKDYFSSIYGWYGWYEWWCCSLGCSNFLNGLKEILKRFFEHLVFSNRSERPIEAMDRKYNVKYLDCSFCVFETFPTFLDLKLYSLIVIVRLIQYLSFCRIS